ncbi:hypothetical protein OOK29_39770 [Streptomyces phaeochromogenes]|uniref:hypothetical protein n=1 Tax=Streptomyces phaeochromogenes TaxID=1923 RepID=UPI0022532A2C|nr:hypothetical protein [Streptomyces phaeochromogenes]MCX5604294.1 hypothetical protein [Streptomyces phaeochromogenes]
MSNTFKYRLRSPLGGLAADLTAGHHALDADADADADDGFRLQIYRNVWLAPPRGINWRDAAWLSFGLSAHSSDLSSAHPGGLLVEVAELTFPLAHFRPEAAALAMDGWVRMEFDLPDRGFRAAFDGGIGAYRFHWGGYSDPFSDES